MDKRTVIGHLKKLLKNGRELYNKMNLFQRLVSPQIKNRNEALEFAIQALENYATTEAEIRAKAIDEFAALFIKESNKRPYLRSIWIEQTCKKIAEQLKEVE